LGIRQQTVSAGAARRYNVAVTAQQALNTALKTDPGERRRRQETMCGLRGSCRPEPLENDPGRWTFSRIV
jgi:hypothetical protein